MTLTSLSGRVLLTGDSRQKEMKLYARFGRFQGNGFDVGSHAGADVIDKLKSYIALLS